MSRVTRHPRRERRDGREALSPRQLHILKLLDEGLRAREIALHLRVSETTVRNHIHAVLERLGCHSQLEAVAKARRLGIIGEERLEADLLSR